MFDIISPVLHGVSGALKVPVMLVLLVFIAITVVMIGWIVAEYFNEHRYLKVQLPQLMDELTEGQVPIGECIETSGLLKTQKKVLIELTEHHDFTEIMLDSLADGLVEEEQERYASTLKATNLLAKLGPMMGLLGTLIPLGPGIIALGQGDTQTLSTSLLTAFDTTIAGLCVAAVAVVITTIRKTWYRKYMTLLEALVDCVLEITKGRTVGS